MADATPRPDAVEEILSQRLLDVVAHATEADLRGPNPAAETKKGNMLQSVGYLHAPALFQFMAQSYKRLLKTAEWSGMKNAQITHVQAKLIGDSKVMLIRPAPDSDRTAYELRRYPRMSGAWVNLFELLGSHGLAVETGHWERYDVAYVPRHSPLWPGLLVDLGTPRDRGTEPKAKKKEASSEHKP